MNDDKFSDKGFAVFCLVSILAILFLPLVGRYYEQKNYSERTGLPSNVRRATLDGHKYYVVDGGLFHTDRYIHDPSCEMRDKKLSNIKDTTVNNDKR